MVSQAQDVAGDIAGQAQETAATVAGQAEEIRKSLDQHINELCSVGEELFEQAEERIGIQLRYFQIIVPRKPSSA